MLSFVNYENPSPLHTDDMRIRKQKLYEQCVSHIVPFVFYANGSMSKSTSNFYHHFDLEVSVKDDEHLYLILGLLRCRRMCIMCIRGVRPSHHKPIPPLTHNW